ncbi:hypothetical protein LJC26_02520 [Desulfovibrio sp. OttesenSCG-928-O18]|nr:hypothetical protein [Desulfovibrio sp. OttesenSCG-928-O18]
MRIRIKYCGGCNPRYDRSAVAEKLRADFPQAEIVVTGDDGPFDYVVVLAGCTAACAAHEDLHGTYGKSIIMSEADYPGVAEAIRAIPG